MQSRLHYEDFTDQLVSWNFGVVRAAALRGEFHCRLFAYRVNLKFLKDLVEVFVFGRTHINNLPLKRMSDGLEGCESDL